MLPDPFSEPGTELNECEPGNSGRSHVPTLSGGFCGVRIRPNCLHIDGGGMVRVGIAATPQEWFETIAQMGEMLHLTSNAVAVMGKFGAAPALADWRNPVLPRDNFGFFTPNLAEYASLWAVREASDLGVLYGLEARNLSGMVFERFLLPPQTPCAIFSRFIATHQSPYGHEQMRPWFPANHAWSARRRANLTGRIPWLQAQWLEDDPRVRLLRTQALSQLLTVAGQAGLPLRTTLYQASQTRTLRWTPAVSNISAPGQSHEFFHGDDVGLHLSLPAARSAWLWAGQCGCCTEERWSIEIFDHSDHLSLALMAGEPGFEDDWRDLIKSVLP